MSILDNLVKNIYEHLSYLPCQDSDYTHFG